VPLIEDFLGSLQRFIFNRVDRGGQAAKIGNPYLCGIEESQNS
jgi:hypothetical protein